MNVLVIDVGTSSMRGILFEHQGKCLTEKQEFYQATYLENSWVEQNPADWENALYSILKQSVAEAENMGEKIDAISITSQRSSVIPVDENIRPLSNAIMWQDKRTNYICESMENLNDKVFSLCGSRVNPVFSGSKMMWIREERPEIYAKTYKFMVIPDYLIYLMTGRICTDYTYGSRSLLMNIRTHEWDDELLEIFHVEKEKLCELVEPGSVCGHITKAFAEITGCQEGIPVIKEINETTASVVLEYQLTSQNDDEETELYDVKEFYRMKYQDTRIYLLDFQRSANQVFDGTLPVYEDDGIILGVRDKNVEYMMNDAATVIAFVQEGDLWSYSPGNEKVNQVFSFRKLKDGDFRDSRTQHDIKIVRVTDEGDIDFVLYGYMNRGSHEGYEGIAVYHYNRDKNVAEERAFIPVSESFEFLKKDLEKLSYVNEKNELFLILAKNLYRINIEENSSEILEKGIKNANFVSSDNNDHAAWLVSEGDEKGNIKEIDFDTCKTRLIAPQKGQRLRTVGFMNEDLIYGMLNKEDILTDEEEHKSVGIRILRIEDFEGNVKKEYRKDGLYITDISVGNTLIEFELSAKSGETSYVAQKKDTIMNNKKAAANTVKIELISASRTGVRVKLVFNTTKQTDSPLTMYAKVSSSDRKDIVLDTQIPQETAYYVYGQGGLNGIYTDPAKAVLRADTLGGVVLNRTQQYVWERGNKKTKMQTEGIPEIVLQGTYDIKTLKKSLKKTGTVIDLSGCSLDSVLYEISAQRPVIAKTGADTSVVIVGYDEYNTWLYDPVKKETYPYGMNDSTDLFQKAGNVFITYIETVNY